MKLEFGDFRFDSESRELSMMGRGVHLTPKAFSFLELLLLNRPRAMSKMEIQEALWSGSFIEESNITSLVSEIRHALRDDSRHPRFLRTVYGFGYAFSGEAREVGETARSPAAGPARDEFRSAADEAVASTPVASFSIDDAAETEAPPTRDVGGAAPEANWYLIYEGRQIGLAEGENIVGRDQGLTVRIGSVTTSRRHARITISGNRAFLADLESKNGTFLNGRTIRGSEELHDGDRIQIAHVVMVIKAVDVERSTVTLERG